MAGPWGGDGRLWSMGSRSVEPPDYYAALGVAPGAEEGEIRAAFRRLAREYHPDVNRRPDAAERFRSLVAAYEVLSDPATRRAYDQRRRSGAGSGPGAGSGTAPAAPGGARARAGRPGVAGAGPQATPS